jgi:hypothetical protein
MCYCLVCMPKGLMLDRGYCERKNGIAMLRLYSLFGLILVLFLSVVRAEEPTVNAIQDIKPASADTPSDYFELERKKITRWNDQTKYIMVYIEDGSHLPGWNPENPHYVKAAFQEWEQAMAPRFHFIFMPDERGSDVKVYWASRLGTDEAGEAAGLNEYQTWGKFINKNNIKLSLLHPSGQIYPSQQIQSTALHEIGHMLGLKAHSQNPEDVMYGKSQAVDWYEVHHLTTRDINTLRKVYESKPDYTNPEGYHLSNFDSFKKTQKGRHISLMWVPIPGVPFPVPIVLPF